MRRSLFVFALVALGAAPAVAAPGGFAQEAAYLDVEGGPLGGRFVHEGTGLVVRVLRIASVPQVFLYVRTLATSDRGEPHTGEHLLLGKGTRGKAVAAAQDMSLVESTAYTGQTETCYSFNCAAGEDTFQRVLAQSLEALLYPDYSDDEIRLEVCHDAVVDDGEGGLRLEEKGTVYNEMVASYSRRWNVFYAMQRRLYGEGHPLSAVTGGSPAGIRGLTPEHIHQFHAQHYHLSPNLGLIVSLPPSIATGPFLERFGETVSQLAAREAHAARPRTLQEIPAWETPAERAIALVPYPNANPQDTGTAVLAWPPVAPLALRDELLAQLFVETLAGGETSLLHRVLIDTATRTVDVPATGMWGDLETTPASAVVWVGLTGYGAQGANEEALRGVEAAIRAEVARIAALAGDDPLLVDLERRIETRLLDLERGLKQRLSMPPLFGRRRGGGGFWLDHLRRVDRQEGAERSLTLAGPIAAVREVLASDGNPWAAVIESLGLTTAPIVGCSVASPAELERRATDKAARMASALERLVERSGVGPAEALQLEGARLSGLVAAIDSRDAAIAQTPLVPDVPRTLDEDLRYSEAKVGGLPVFRAHFDAMSTVEVALALDIAGLAREQLVLLPLLGRLLTGAGVRDADGERLAYDQLQEQLDRETGGLTAALDLAPRWGRYELLITATGSDVAEAKGALSWLTRCLFDVDLSVDNLPRLRDLTRQAAQGLRAQLGGSEEGWVRNPAAAVRYQRDHLFLSADSIHARLYHLFRLRWLLAAPPAGDAAQEAAQVFACLRALNRKLGPEAALAAVRAGLLEGTWPEAAAGAPFVSELSSHEPSAFRGELEPLLDALTEVARDLPPATATADFDRVVSQVEDDLARDPGETLAGWTGLLVELRRRSRARYVLTGRPANLDALGPELTRLAGRLGDGAPRRATPDLTAASPVVDQRVQARSGDARRPVHLGLVSETASSGVFVLSAELAEPVSTDPEHLVDLLAGSIDGGSGPHAFFMNTWAAGLAYSNGLRPSPLDGRINYYAERCPDLVQTMKFVVGLAQDADRHDDAYLAEYALAQVVSRHRMSDRFESRARAMAADLLAGITPDRVRAQRTALLALREQADLWERVSARHLPVTGRVLVGLGARSREQPGGVFLTIAPERLLKTWEGYVQEVEGAEERVHRLYPADLWVR